MDYTGLNWIILAYNNGEKNQKQSYTNAFPPLTSLSKIGPKSSLLVPAASMRRMHPFRFEMMEQMVQNAVTVNGEHQHGASGSVKHPQKLFIRSCPIGGS
jgi:hypothetical protein